MANRFVWSANLSDGESYAEADLDVSGGKSAFQKLMDIMAEKAATLTGFRFQKNGTTHNAPSASPKAKFPTAIPFTLDYRRRATQVLGDSGVMQEDRFCRYIVRAEGLKISLWVEDSSGDTWMQIERISNGIK